MGPETMNSFRTTYSAAKDTKDAELLKLMRCSAKLTGCMGNMTLTYKGYNRYVRLDYWDCKLHKQYPSEKLAGYVNTFFLWDYVHATDNNLYSIKSLSNPTFQETYNSKENDGHSRFLRNEPIREFLIEESVRKDYYKNVNWAIRRRGIFIALMLSIALGVANNDKRIADPACHSESLRVSEAYAKIMRDVFMSAETYSGYDAVFSRIDKALSREEREKYDDILKDARDKLR